MVPQILEQNAKKAEARNAPVPHSASGAKKHDGQPLDKNRRRMIWGLLGGYLGINLLMFFRFFFPRALYEPNTSVNIGFPTAFQQGVNQEFLQSNRLWVVLEPGRLFVIFARCTHLGCTPDWLPQQNMFHCPCHGSEYDPEGVNFAGPAPRPMDRCKVTLLGNGTVQVDSSHLFMEDPRAGLNQFNDPDAYVSI
ncbi:MAG: ubiquinol-cytochrome c reductase iron-sulfur subunit [Candidatus Acidiferrales bacterium]